MALGQPSFDVSEIRAKHLNISSNIMFWDIVVMFQDIEMLGWCPASSVLPYGGGNSLALVGHTSSNGVKIKIPYG